MIYKIFLLFPLFIIIPTIIHFLSRKRIKEEFFPSLLFLYEKEKRLRNYIRFEEIILFIVRALLIFSLSFAGGLVLIPFKFIGKNEFKKIYDTSLSMEGRIQDNVKYETVNINGIADFEKTFEKYRFGVIVSDMQEINFKSILKKNKKYKYFIPEVVNLPEENNSIKDIEYNLGNNLIISVKIKREGKTKREEIVLFFDDVKYEKNALLNNGDNVVEFEINEKIKNFHRITCIVKDELIFDNVYYKVIYSPEGRTIKILSSDEPKFLIKALKKYKVEWIKELNRINKDDILIIDNYNSFIDINYLSKLCFKIILSLNDSIQMSDVKVKKINDKYSDIENDKFLILTDEPIKYNWYIEGGKTLINFKNGDNAVIKKDNIFICAFSLQAKELVYHTYYLPFLYSLIEESLKDFELNAEIGDTILGDFDQILTPDGTRFFNIKEIITDKRGFYTIIKGKDTLFVAVNPRNEEYNLKILEKEKIESILSRKKLYDGTSFFLFIFLTLLILEKILERR